MDRALTIILICINILGFLIVIFKGGSYIGTTQANFKTLFNNDAEVKKDLQEHIKEDKKVQDKLLAEMNLIKIAIAGLGSNHGKR